MFTATSLTLPRLQEAARKRRKQAFRPGTSANHICQFKAYIKFCAIYGRRDINPSQDTLCIYIEYLAQKFKSAKSVKNYLSAVTLLHKYVGADTTQLQSFETDLMLRAIKLTMLHTPRQRREISTDILTRLSKVCDKQGLMGANLKCAVLFAYFGFLRQSNLAPTSAAKFDPRRDTCRGDILTHPPGLIILLKWTKTNQEAAQPTLIPLPQIPAHHLCPLTAYQQLLALCPTRTANQPLFTLPDAAGQQQPLSTRTLQQAFGAAIHALRLPPHTFTLHDLRRAGATTAYKAGLDFAHIKRHGTWRSDAFWHYITPAGAAMSPVPHALAAAVQ